jgi:hypothetical protein
MSFSVDASEVTALGRQLLVASVLTFAGAKPVVEKAALNVKNDARQRISGLRHAPGYPNSIQYEMVGIQAEVGPEVGGPQWGLGDILEYGTSKSAPHPHLMPAAEAELPNLERLLVELATKAIR